MSKINVIKRKDGRFEARVTISKYNRKSVYGDTEAEARKKARQLEKNALKYDLSNISKMTVEDYLSYWLETKRYSVKPASFDRIALSIKYQITPYIGSLQISQLAAEDVEVMLSKLAETTSYSTLKKAYNNLNSCLKSAEIKGHIIRNPMIAVTLPQFVEKKTKEMRVYSKEEIVKIISEATRTYSNGKYIYRYGYAFIILLNTGMRLGELLYLHWKDVDQKNKRIHVIGSISEHKKRSDTGYEITETTTKTKNSMRYIPINNNVINALIHIKNTIGNDKLVICSHSGNYVSPHNIYRQFQNILKKCDIEANDIIHALRHTFATALIEKGEDIKVVSELLGHGDISVTLNTYHHVIEENKVKAVENLDDLF